MSEREDDIVAAFVSLAGSLAQGHDVTELLTSLTADCARLLDVSAAGLLLADPKGALHVVAASSSGWRTSRRSRPSGGRAPATPATSTAAPSTSPTWPPPPSGGPRSPRSRRGRASPASTPSPCGLRDQVVGALNLFGGRPGSLNAPDLRLAQALADVATVALVQERAAADRELVNEQLQKALDSRVVLEQAKGVLAYSGDLDMTAAYAALRTYARDHNVKLADLAQALVNRAVPAALVLEHARARQAGARPSQR
jgi:hypothetical protein